MRRERDEQLGFIRRRRGACSEQTLAKRSIGLAEEAEERTIDADEAFALVEIREGDAEAKLHEVRIIVEFSRH